MERAWRDWEMVAVESGHAEPEGVARYHRDVRPRLRRAAETHLPGAWKAAWEVDDLLDEALARALSAFERKRSVDPDHPGFFDMPAEKMRKYLRAAIVDVAVDLRRRLMQAKGPGGTVPRLGGDPPADHTSPTARARRRETLARLSEALAGLSREHYEAIRLHYLEGLPYGRVAVQMGKTPAAVAGLIRRGLERLRDSLPSGDYGPGDVG